MTKKTMLHDWYNYGSLHGLVLCPVRELIDSVDIISINSYRSFILISLGKTLMQSLI
jgi:hypothetical protein